MKVPPQIQAITNDPERAERLSKWAISLFMFFFVIFGIPNYVLPSGWGVCAGPVRYGFCDQGQSELVRSVAEDEAWQKQFLATQFSYGDTKELYFWSLRLSYTDLSPELSNLAMVATEELADKATWISWLNVESAPADSLRQGEYVGLELYGYIAEVGANAKLVNSWDEEWRNRFDLGRACVFYGQYSRQCQELRPLVADLLVKSNR